MTRGYSLKCSVCQGQFLSKSQWSVHLTGKRHQLLAMAACLREWNQREIKQCCLVVFSSFSMEGVAGCSGAEKVIRYFSQKVSTFVTDVVWWEDRPCVAVVQFESRKKLREVITSRDHLMEAEIGGDRILMKPAVDLADLEWFAILPRGSEDGNADALSTLSSSVLRQEPREQGAEETVHCERIKTLEKRSLEASTEDSLDDEFTKRRKLDEVSISSLESPTEEVIQNPVAVLAELAERSGWPPPVYLFNRTTPRGERGMFCCNAIVNDIEYKYSDITPQVASCNMRRGKARISRHCLKLLTRALEDVKEEFDIRHQFWSICNFMSISEPEYKITLEVKSRVDDLFRQNDPMARVELFRNWHLKLRNAPGSKDPILICVYLAKPQDEISFCSYCMIPPATVTNILRRAKTEFTIMTLPADPDDVEGTASKELPEWTVKCNKSGVIFYVTNVIGLRAEIQVCRLVKYMCTFDNRCHSLLALAKYFVAANKIKIGHTVDYKLGKYPAHTLMEPHSLEWLLMFFLCYKKMIPTPREIQRQPHVTLYERRLGIDIGFEESADFPREWMATHKSDDTTAVSEASEEFAMNVLSLFQEFLDFCGSTLNCGKWILNTRDGELIGIDKFLTCNPDDDKGSPESSWTTKMTSEELAEFKSIQKGFPEMATDEGGNGKSDTREIPTSRSSAAKQPGSYFLNLRRWKIYMLHPFISSRKVSVGKQIRLDLKIMSRRERQLKTFLNVVKHNGMKVAVLRFGTLENVLTVDK